MSVVKLVEQLHACDIRPFLDGDNLKLDAPKGTVTDKQLADLRRQKSEIIDLLKGRATTTPAESHGTVERYPLNPAKIWEKLAPKVSPVWRLITKDFILRRTSKGDVLFF